MKNRHLKNKELAERLFVSTSTIHNWKRQGIIPQNISKAEFEKILPSLQKRQSDRANKTRSAKTFIPHELLDEGLSVESIKALLKILSVARGIRKKIALCASLILWQHEEITFDADGKTHFRRDIIGTILHDFYADKLATKELVDQFQQLNIPPADDILGIIYQSILKEGKKSLYGSYFTPKDLATEMLRSHSKDIDSILDPCCGSGTFLCIAAKELSLPLTAIYGIDNDPIAVFITKINLLLHFKDENTTPKIICHDVLRHNLNLEHPIDIIISNPPWGALKKITKRHDQDAINTSDSASEILIHVLQQMDEKTKLIFLLPYSLLNIKAHKDVRTKLLKDYTIKHIHYSGRPFDGVLSDTFWIEIEHKTVENTNITICHPNDKISVIAQKTFLENPEHIININADELDLKLLNKIYKTPHTTLKGNALWSLGIVTGNNKKYLSTEARTDRKPIVRGTDIRPYRMSSPRQYIEFKPSLFQQFSNISFFEAPEKLIYRFISSSLIFAYDDSQCLTLNSANILIPQIKGYPLKVVLAILNSKLMQYVFKKTFATHKVLKSDLCQLPIPLLDDDTKQKILQEVDKVIHNDASADIIDEMIFKHFSLTEEETKRIRSIDE